MDLKRRDVLHMGALGLISVSLAGCDRLMTPREAQEQGADFQTLTPDEVVLFDRYGEVLLPGAAEAGFTHFIDSQISNPPEDLLSLLKYMDWPPPFVDFYRPGIMALESVCQSRTGMSFAETEENAAIELVREISGSVPEGWDGPPAPLFYFVTRSDAVDVVYGTMEGFDRLNVPYLAHIEPSEPW